MANIDPDLVSQQVENWQEKIGVIPPTYYFSSSDKKIAHEMEIQNHLLCMQNTILNDIRLALMELATHPSRLNS